MHVLRTLACLSVSVVCLAACGGNAGAPTADPQFVAPSELAAESPSAEVSSVPPTSASPTAVPSASPSTSVKPSASPPKNTKSTYVFPVKASNVSWHTTHSGYRATDIFADCGLPVVATTSGVVLEISRTDRYVEGAADGPNNGGLFVSILGDDGVRYYGSHLSKVLSGIRGGVRVSAGQQVGKLGKTGNSSGVCHLHYGISPPCAKTGDWKVRRGVVWPYSYLSSWRGGGRKSPVAAVAAWKSAHNCKA